MKIMKIAKIYEDKLDDGRNCLVIEPSLMARLLGKKIIIIKDDIKNDK